MGKGWSYEKRDHFYKLYYRAMGYRARLRGRRLEGLDSLSGPTRYPEGLRLMCKASSDREGEVRILLTESLKEQLTSYLGNESCWIRLKVRETSFIKEYGPDKSFFHLPRGISKLGEMVEVTISRLSISEFVTTAVRESKAQFGIGVGTPNSYHLVIKKERIPLTLVMNLHFEDGALKKPAAIFAITDYLGQRHGIKIAYDGYKEPYIAFKLRIGPAIKANDLKGIISDYKRIVRLAYHPEIGLLEVKYYADYRISSTVVWLNRPEFEKLVVDTVFNHVSQGEVKGIVRAEAYGEIDWHPASHRIEKGILGTKIECSVLKRLGIEKFALDLSGRNDIDQDTLNNFDLIYFDESGNFTVEEVKLITSEQEHAVARHDAIESLEDCLKTWNEEIDNDRKKFADIALPKKIYKGRIVIITFKPMTGEFTRDVDWYEMKKSGS